MAEPHPQPAAPARRARGVPHLLGLWGGLALAGCARSTRAPCENPPPLYVRLQASDRLNPDAQGQSLSAQVQLLELKGTDRLENADFEDVWQKPKETLGDELVQLREVTLDPGAHLTVGLARDVGATALAVVGIFRQPTGSGWRAIAPLAPPDPDRCGGAPAPIQAEPGKEDTVLPFRLEDFRVEPLSGKGAP